jgi:hypothetical protein
VLLQKAVELAWRWQQRLQPSRQSFDESARLTFKQRLAFCYIRMGDGAIAEQLFRELIAAFTRVTGPESANVLRVRLNLAQAYMIERKHEQAVAEATAIYLAFVARLGLDHELTMQLLTTRAQSEGALGRWNDAVRDDMAVHELAVKKQGPMAFFSVATLSDAALAMCRAGRLAEGEANARNAYDSPYKAFGPKAGLTGGTADTLAECLIGTNKLDEAKRLLEAWTLLRSRSWPVIRTSAQAYSSCKLKSPTARVITPQQEKSRSSHADIFHKRRRTLPASKN